MQIEDQLEVLRKQYKEFPEKRGIIKLQARALQIAIEKRDETKPILKVKTDKQIRDEIQIAEEVFEDL